MPLDAWIVLLASVGLGLGLEIAFIRTRRRRGPTDREPGGDA
jgi:hypothetical protein